MTTYSISQLLAQAACYKILAALFDKPVAGVHDNKTHYDTLVKSTELMKPKALEMAKKFRGTAMGLHIADLMPEYIRLFTGLTEVQVCPCSSNYFSNLTAAGDTTQWLANFYDNAGFVYGQLNEPMDHITTELKFLYHLLNKAGEGYQLDDSNMVSRFSELRCRFIKDHMIKWVPEFSRCILIQSKSPYYLQLSILNRTLLVNCTGEINEIPD